MSLPINYFTVCVDCGQHFCEPTCSRYVEPIGEEVKRLRAELAALRAELKTAHAAQRNAEKELSQYMAWYAMAEHQHLHEQRRAEKAEAEAARLLAALKFAERHCPCGARPESPNTHPHVPGCVIAAALEAER